MEKVWAEDFMAEDMTDGWSGQADTLADAIDILRQIKADYPDNEVRVTATILQGKV